MDYDEGTLIRREREKNRQRWESRADKIKLAQLQEVQALRKSKSGVTWQAYKKIIPFFRVTDVRFVP